MKTSFLISLFAFTMLAVPASAQETISTDRPGLGYNPTVIERGIFQAELGLPSAAASSFGETDVRTYSFPVALRYGLVGGLELRLGTSIYDIARVETGGEPETESTAGFDVLQAGLKWNLAAHTGIDIALLPSVLIPAEESGDVAFSGVVVAAWGLPNNFGLNTSAGVFVQSGDISGDLVAVLGRSLTNRLGGYVEAAAYPADGATPVYVGGGVALLVSPDLQLDAHVDRGLNDDDWLFGAGLSFRLR